MKINDDLIGYLEQLSRLSLTSEEKEQAKQDLSKILDCIDALEDADTENVEEMSHAFDFCNNFREDELVPSLDRDLILRNAPQQKSGCFRVAKTVE